MKVNRHGKAKLLTPHEIQLLFTEGLYSFRDRTIFAVCLFTAARINEAVTLHTNDVYDPKGQVRPELIFRKSHTKGRLATRSIPVLDELRNYLIRYQPQAGTEWLFPGGTFRDDQTKHITSDSASRVLRKAFKRVGIDGGSTHSMRRTALTQMNNAGIPLRTIQEISGHRNLQQLQRYLEVQPEQVRGAIAALNMIAPVGGVIKDDTRELEVTNFKPHQNIHLTGQ